MSLKVFNFYKIKNESDLDFIIKKQQEHNISNETYELKFWFIYYLVRKYNDSSNVDDAINKFIESSLYDVSNTYVWINIYKINGDYYIRTKYPISQELDEYVINYSYTDATDGYEDYLVEFWDKTLKNNELFDYRIKNLDQYINNIEILKTYKPTRDEIYNKVEKNLASRFIENYPNLDSFHEYFIQYCETRTIKHSDPEVVNLFNNTIHPREVNKIVNEICSKYYDHIDDVKICIEFDKLM